MTNFITQEGVFVSGLLFLTVLIAGTSYANQQHNTAPMKSAAAANPIIIYTDTSHTSVSSSSDTVIVPVTPKSQMVALPTSARQEEEYDDN